MRILFIAFIILLTKPLSGQTSIGVNIGYGTFAMRDMKTIQEEIANSFLVHPKITSSFPSYYVFEVFVRVPLRHHLVLQFSGEKGSTGGKMSYSDYSGSLGSTQLASYIALKGSFGFSHSLDPSNKWIIQFMMIEGVSFNSAEITSFQTVGTSTETDNVDFTGTNLFIQPEVILTRKLNNRIGIDAFAGYNIVTAKGEMKTSYGGTLVATSHKAAVDFSGSRIGIGLNYFFKNKRG